MDNRPAARPPGDRTNTSLNALAASKPSARKYAWVIGAAVGLLALAIGPMINSSIATQQEERDAAAAAEVDQLRANLDESCISAVRSRLSAELDNATVMRRESTSNTYKIHGVAKGAEFACVLYADGDAYSAFLYPTDGQVTSWINTYRPSP